MFLISLFVILLVISVAEAIGTLLALLFTAADSYLGITIIFGAYALFWFVGYFMGHQSLNLLLLLITYANIETNLPITSSWTTR